MSSLGDGLGLTVVRSRCYGGGRVSPSMAGRIYLDHAATTPLDTRILESMLPYLRDSWGNPSSPYAEAQQARRGMEWARRILAEALGCTLREIVFTSGGSESDNLALHGAAGAGWAGANHIVATAIEHHAVLHTAERLGQQGFDITYLGVDSEGCIDLGELERSVGPQTALVSVMYVNNEVGVIQPIEEAARIVKGKNPRTIFHTDAVQAMGRLDCNVDRLGVDLLSIGAHKLYGPKGVGALYVRGRTRFEPQMLGGSQERGRRAGTENVPYIVGLGRAIELAYEEFDSRNAHYRSLRDMLLRQLPDRVPFLHLTGPADPCRRVSNNFSCCLESVEGEAVLMALDLQGVAASSGSACTSGSVEPSHVLTAMGVPEQLARGSLRLTVGKENSVAEIERLLDIFPAIVAKLRSLSPGWERLAPEAAS